METPKQEFIKNIEQEKEYTSRIKLSFFRHGKKENDKSKPDYQIRLTESGRKDSVEKSDTLNIKQSVAFGSQRKRTQETAALRMAGNQEEITGEETLEELKRKLDSEFHGVGSKIGVDRRLNFHIDTESDFGKTSLENCKDDHYLKFLVENSDKMAKETGDKKSFTYSQGASNVAKIIEKYLKISDRWDNLVKDSQKNYDNTLERYFGTHLSVGECFLARVIEETEGKERRDEFIQALNNQGFDYNEGFDLEILKQNEARPIVHIFFRKELDDKKGERKTFVFDTNLGLDLIKKIAENNQ